MMPRLRKNIFDFPLLLTIVLLVSTCLTNCDSGKKAATMAVKPNIIIIMADDLGYGGLSCYGNKEIHTPYLDQMAVEGMRFTDFHSNGAVCSPTRAALLTGKYQQRVGIEGVVTAKSHRTVGLALEEVTFADALREEGYVNGMVGKWHLGYPATFNPTLQGFDQFRGFVSGNVDYHAHFDQENYEDWWWQDTLHPEEGYSTDLITKHAVNFIEAHQKENFLLYIAHEAPHYPIQGRQSAPTRGPEAVQKSLSDTESNEIYKEMIEVMDEGIGKVLHTLKELNIDKNTLVFFFSDNGPAKLGSSGGLRGGKASVWEGGHRVPAIARWPGQIQAKQENTSSIMTMDIFPTLMSVVGADQKLDWDGIDISPALLANKTLPDRNLFWRHFNNAGTRQASAVRNGDWKLIRNGKDGEAQLFNLRDDLAERQNVAALHPAIREQLTKALANWESSITRGITRVSP